MADRVRPQKLEVAHPNAAGIDIGSGSHFVAVRGDADETPVREFLSFTEDLEALARWLTQCGVDVVAMESTGVYWIPLYELLESRGFTVHLVNARHVKNVSGRKSDVLDCQWLQQLMSYGLLSGAFRPQEQICVLRTVSRQRDMLVQYQTKHVQHMQKALTQMNVQLDNVISEITGETAQKIVRAIVAGEREIAYADCRCRTPIDSIDALRTVLVRRPGQLVFQPHPLSPRALPHRRTRKSSFRGGDFTDRVSHEPAPPSRRGAQFRRSLLRPDRRTFRHGDLVHGGLAG